MISVLDVNKFSTWTKSALYTGCQKKTPSCTRSNAELTSTVAVSGSISISVKEVKTLQQKLESALVGVETVA